LAKLKVIDVETYPQEVLADEEPKYLRRQRPVEIKRRKFGRKAWKTYLRVSLWVLAAAGGAWLAYDVGHFLLASPQMMLVHPDQVSLSGNHYVTTTSVREIFAGDRGKSVLRIPLDQRRREIEMLPWVEQAIVRRALPNKIQIDITERNPVAFVRESSDLALIDAHGAILDRPVEADFHFPVITGIDAGMPLPDREERMQLFSGFTQQIESVRSGATDGVSEVDLSAEHDVRATLTGLDRTDVNDASTPNGSGFDAPVVVHFGDSDFAGKYQTLVEEFAQWRAKAGPIESVDLRFSREAVVNQDTTALAQQRPLNLSVVHGAKHSP
jgi:cell division protein FtsQ